jgi:hypothetical protein
VSPPTPYVPVESFEHANVPLRADAGVIRGRRLVLIRTPDFETFPDGDAPLGRVLAGLHFSRRYYFLQSNTVDDSRCGPCN